MARSALAKRDSADFYRRAVRFRAVDNKLNAKIERALTSGG
jgi:hypothetical protein